MKRFSFMTLSILALSVSTAASQPVSPTPFSINPHMANHPTVTCAPASYTLTPEAFGYRLKGKIMLPSSDTAVQISALNPVTMKLGKSQIPGMQTTNERVIDHHIDSITLPVIVNVDPAFGFDYDKIVCDVSPELRAELDKNPIARTTRETMGLGTPAAPVASPDVAAPDAMAE